MAPPAAAPARGGQRDFYDMLVAREWKPFLSLAYATLATVVVVTLIKDAPQWALALLSPMPILLLYAAREGGEATPAAVRDSRSLWRLLYVTAVAVAVLTQIGDVALWTVQMLAPLPLLSLFAYKEMNDNKAKAE
ncbi:hypothetical protein Gpo141_00005116 [Globisporangium polare]